MSDPNANHIGFARAFQDYLDKGWRGILPLRYGSKWPPPKGFTGYASPDPSYPDLITWADDDLFRQGNLGLRLPDGVIGIDVDEYGAKAGASTFAEAIRRWGPLPDAPRTTSREGNKISGIRLFAVPLGTMLVTKMEFDGAVHLGDVEIIQPHHRYAMSWPSVHPEGGTYWWRNDNDQLIGIPELGDLPTLPQTWLDGLAVTHESNLDLAPVNLAVALTEGKPSAIVRRRLGQAFQELNMPGCSRHDTCTRHVMALMRYGKSGEPGVSQALAQLGQMLIAIRAGDGTGDEKKTKAEFRRMVFGDNIARELAKPGVNDWIRDLIVFEASDDETPRPAPLAGVAPDLRGELDQSTTGVSPDPAESRDEGNSKAPSTNAGCDLKPSPSQEKLESLEGDFWQSRDSLNIIYTAALARMVSPWAVLAFCAARALTQVQPNWTLPPIIGGAGSLNWFAAVVDRSGGGKTTAKALAGELVSGDVREKNVGSGEGIIGQFYKPPAKQGETAEIHTCNMFNCDEVETLTAMGSRSGSTTMSILRSAFSGDTLGFAYIARGRDVHLERHSYRMTLVVGVQPGRAGELLDQSHGGTPQRFMWFPANDERCTEEARSQWIPGPIEIPRMETYPRELTVPPEAEQLIIQTRAQNARGESDALDGHALFCREKLAFALAILDGRIEMSSEDWRLSGVAAEVSHFTRAEMTADLAKAREQEAMEKGRLLGISGAMSDEEKVIRAGERVQRIVRWVFRKLDEKGPLKPGELTRAATSRDRPWLENALVELRTAGLIGLDAEGRWARLG